MTAYPTCGGRKPVEPQGSTPVLPSGQGVGLRPQTLSPGREPWALGPVSRPRALDPVKWLVPDEAHGHTSWRRTPRYVADRVGVNSDPIRDVRDKPDVNTDDAIAPRGEGGEKGGQAQRALLRAEALRSRLVKPAVGHTDVGPTHTLRSGVSSATALQEDESRKQARVDKLESRRETSRLDW